MDTVANILNSLINAQRVNKKRVVLPYARFTAEVLGFLQTKGMIAKVREEQEPKRRLMVTLAYDDKQPRMHGIKRLSKPGQRRYVSKDDIPFSLDGLGMMVLSTSAGVMDGKTARKKGMGGELLFEVW